MRIDRKTTQVEQPGRLSIRSRHPNRSRGRQYHKQSPNTMHRSKSSKGSPHGRGIHRPVQRSNSSPGIQNVQAHRQDYEWLNGQKSSMRANSSPAGVVKNRGARPITPIIGNANVPGHTKKRNTSTRNARAYCGQDYEWHIALANLYDQGWPEIPHSHPRGNKAKLRSKEQR